MIRIRTIFTQVVAICSKGKYNRHNSRRILRKNSKKEGLVSGSQILYGRYMARDDAAY